MFSIFKKLFAKREPKTVPAIQAAPVVPAAPASSSMPTVEVAHLSLAAIVRRFPEELDELVIGQPDEAATVALPLQTILKQLPAGVVKMSLATLHRQAHGIIRPLPAGDKRTVEVPLAEIFRHVRPSSLRRRPDQRTVYVPESGFNLFGDSTNPYAIAPDEFAEPPPVVLDLTADVAPEPPRSGYETPRVLQMDDAMREHFSNGSGVAPSAPPNERGDIPRILAPPPEFGMAKPAAARAAVPAVAKVAKPEGPTLTLPLAALSTQWPDEIRKEIAGFAPETTVTLPADVVSAGLAKGRVTFTWQQIHAWLEPEPAAPSAVAGGTALQLPLKVVAPAFLSTSKKPAADRKSLDMDESIPALFSDARPAPEPAPAEAEAPAAIPEAEAKIEPTAEATAEATAEVAPESRPEPEPPAVEKAAAPARAKPPETIGEVFGQPHKKDWTPAEIVSGTVKLPGVAGAIVALQEGLQVSSLLPEGVKSEVVAAFLPQIFARLNQYAGEMRLGDVDDFLFTTHGAHCQIYRLGYIYFAVLGKAGESLPWHELRLITEELARQTHK